MFRVYWAGPPTSILVVSTITTSSNGTGLQCQKCSNCLFEKWAVFAFWLALHCEYVVLYLYSDHYIQTSSATLRSLALL